MVFCRLCGKSVKRSFMATVTNYAEALSAAREYADEHLASPVHRAALEALYADESPALTKDEQMLAEIFRQPPPDEGQRRRTAARLAAEEAKREQWLATQREQSAAAMAKQQEASA